MAFVGNCIKLAREKAGLSREVLAESVKLPKSFLEDIESGEYINRNGEKSADAWWKDCGDGSIKEKVAEYLCCALNPNAAKKSEKNAQLKGTDSEDLLPF